MSLVSLAVGVVLGMVLGGAAARHRAGRRAGTATAVDAAPDRFGDAIDGLGASSARLNDAGPRLTALVEHALTGAAASVAASGKVLAASQAVSGSLAAIRSGTEELTASISEISRGASEATTVAAGAFETSADARRRMAKLRESSSGIGEIVKVITGIAQQTNLLSLNATIEAARAGNLGKGFAVVAGEVKELAQGTARATDDITGRIAAIQADIQGALASIDQIAAVIEQVHGYQSAIAEAVLGRSVTIDELDRSVAEAATEAAGITATMTAVARKRKEAKVNVEETQAVALEIERIRAELATTIDRLIGHRAL